MEQIETVIVGGGQAGLATSYYLKQHGREHIILEQAVHAANVWRNERWDSFTLVTPNWTLKMPGAEYNGADPDGFMPREQVIEYFEQYVQRFKFPIECNTRVISVEPMESKGYRIQTPDRTFQANNVVIATGWCQRPKLPAFARSLSAGISQLHSSAYRNPQALPAGAVLVVGSAQSGCQIAEELCEHGRKVYLCTGSAGRLPRRYRGKDVIRWLDEFGFFSATPDQLPPGTSKFGGIPQLSGKNGGHTLNLHQLAHDGVTLLGHLRGGAGEKIWLAADLYENLTKVDTFERLVLGELDGIIQAHGLDAPQEVLPQLRDGYKQPILEALDLKAAGISTIIWAMGYTFDYHLVKLPVMDSDGFPIQTHGVTGFAGLYFVGMPWMPYEKPHLLLGVGEAAEHIASMIEIGGAHS